MPAIQSDYSAASVRYPLFPIQEEGAPKPSTQPAPVEPPEAIAPEFIEDDYMTLLLILLFVLLLVGGCICPWVFIGAAVVLFLLVSVVLFLLVSRAKSAPQVDLNAEENDLVIKGNGLVTQINETKKVLSHLKEYDKKMVQNLKLANLSQYVEQKKSLETLRSDIRFMENDLKGLEHKLEKIKRKLMHVQLQIKVENARQEFN